MYEYNPAWADVERSPYEPGGGVIMTTFYICRFRPQNTKVLHNIFEEKYL